MQHLNLADHCLLYCHFSTGLLWVHWSYMTFSLFLGRSFSRTSGFFVHTVWDLTLKSAIFVEIVGKNNKKII